MTAQCLPIRSRYVPARLLSWRILSAAPSFLPQRSVCFDVLLAVIVASSVVTSPPQEKCTLELKG